MQKITTNRWKHFLFEACIVIGLLLMANSGMAEEIYKWVDKDGNIHFSDTPVENETEEKDIELYEPKNRNLTTVEGGIPVPEFKPSLVPEPKKEPEAEEENTDEEEEDPKEVSQERREEKNNANDRKDKKEARAKKNAERAERREKRAEKKKERQEKKKSD